MKVLVTGGSGFIGTHLREALREAGHTCVNYDIRDADDGDPFIFGDISTNFHRIKKVFREEAFDIVFHLAAQTSVPVSVQNPAHDARTNVMGTLGIIELCRDFGVKLVFASTAAVYGPPRRLPLLECDPSEPVSPYGISKAACESYIKAALTDYTIVRFANVYGVKSTGIIATFLERAQDGLPLRVYGNGTQTRDYIYVKDLVRALIQCIDKAGGLTLNLSTQVPESVNGVIEAVRVHYPQVQVIRGLDVRPGDVPDSLMSNNHAKRELDWAPAYSLADGIRDMLQEQSVLERE